MKALEFWWTIARWMGGLHGKATPALVGDRAGASMGILSQDERDLDDHVFSPRLRRELQGLEPFNHTTLKALIPTLAFFHIALRDSTIRAHNQGEDDLALWAGLLP